METMVGIVRDQKIRFLASEVLFKGSEQTVEDVCSDCHLFTVTPTELLEFIDVPVKFGNCHATALSISSRGSVYVTQAFCHEVGKQSILNPFSSLYQNQCGKWLGKTSPVAPSLRLLEKSSSPSRLLIGESSCSQVPDLDEATQGLSTPPVGELDVLQCPSDGDTALTHASMRDRKFSVQSSATQWPINGGPTLSRAQRGVRRSFLASSPRGSTEFSTCRPNCESASSQGRTKGGVAQEGHELGHEGLLQRHENAISPTWQVQKTEGIIPALGALAGCKHSVPGTGRKPKAAQKLELRSEIPKEVQSGIDHKFGLSSRITRSATAYLTERTIETPQKKDGEPCDDVCTTGTPKKRKRGTTASGTVNQESVEANLFNSARTESHPVTGPEFGVLDPSEVVSETRITLAGTEKSGAVHLENPILAKVPKTEAESLLKRGKKRSKAGSGAVRSTWKASPKHGGTKLVTKTSFPLISTPGPLCGQSEKSACEESAYRGNAIEIEQEFGGKPNQPPTSPNGGSDAVTPPRNENSLTRQKPISSERAQILFVGDSEEDLSAAELLTADVKAQTSSVRHANPNGVRDQPRRLCAALLGAEKRSPDTEMMLLQAVNHNPVCPAEFEEATGTEVASRTGSLQHLTHINDYLREMNTTMTSSPAEHVECAWTARASALSEERLKSTVPEVQRYAGFLCSDFAGGALLDQGAGGLSGCSENKLPVPELGPFVNATIDSFNDINSQRAHPGNKTATLVGKKSRVVISKEHLEVLEAVVPTNVKVVDTFLKQRNQELKIVPEFDNYTVIGEEGSGGYGTVYRVKDNATERMYAMKCPLLKTHFSCVDNEIKMLQQLGGKEFIIKYENVVPGRFRTSSDSTEKLSECKSILLELIEHDKPEVLKKEITIDELRHYSLCLFRALAYMHKLRIMHLDVKPGNFLFSRSKKRGYLVDFNLARDEQNQSKRMKKVLTSSSHSISRIDSSRSKRPPVQDVGSTPVSFSKRSRLLIEASRTELSYGTPSPAKTLSVIQDYNNKYVGQKVSSPRLPDLATSRSTTPMCALSSPRTAQSPQPANEQGDLEARLHYEGIADVQKNQTLGPRTQTAHRALLKYIQTKVYKQEPPGFNQQQSLPASQRKRVAAVQSKKKDVAAGSVPVTQHALQPSIARRFKAPAKPKGHNDQINDGPCFGTKGYRAPEVLLRSLKQTTKVDIWSAGVSVLHLISGRSPFPSTTTDGALKDIAKVRGSDKVLALATRHQRHNSISKELCAMRYSPVALKEWCEKYSKRSDLKGKIPPELFDLLEKCLDVDPDSRITAEDALKHQFFSSL